MFIRRVVFSTFGAGSAALRQGGAAAVTSSSLPLSFSTARCVMGAGTKSNTFSLFRRALSSDSSGAGKAAGFTPTQDSVRGSSMLDFGESEASSSADSWNSEMEHQSNLDPDHVEPPPIDQHFRAYVHASYNNTKITITNNEGRTITWSSCGKVGFKGAKRSTSFAAQTCGQRCAEDSVEKGVPAVRVLLKGLGAGRQTAVKGLQMGGLEIVSVTDTTPIPHNGCRPKKARRI